MGLKLIEACWRRLASSQIAVLARCPRTSPDSALLRAGQGLAAPATVEVPLGTCERTLADNVLVRQNTDRHI